MLIPAARRKHRLDMVSKFILRYYLLDLEIKKKIQVLKEMVVHVTLKFVEN